MQEENEQRVSWQSQIITQVAGLQSRSRPQQQDNISRGKPIARLDDLSAISTLWQTAFGAKPLSKLRANERLDSISPR